jgi:hypothetical protein
MPFVERATASMTFTLVDETGSRGTVSFDIPQATNADAALTAASAVRGFIANITNCSIVSQAVTYSTFDTTPEPAGAGSRVENKGTFVFRTAAGKTARYQVPGIEPSMVLKSGRIQEDAVGVAAFIGAMIATDAIFSDSNGSDLVSLKEAFQRFRTTTRKMLPSDRTPDADALTTNEE